MKKIEPSSRCGFFKITNVPGPGAYTIPSTICEGPSITIKGKIPCKNRSQSAVPGPGHYSIPENKIPGYAIGLSKRENIPPDNIKSNLPGPGSYTIAHEYMGTPWKFAQPYKKPKVKDNELGPGSYDLKSTLSKKSFTMSGKIKKPENKMQKIVPGPGAYNPEFVRSKSSVMIGVSKRPEIKNNNMPGPGAYNIKARPLSCASFGRAKRGEIGKTVECHESYDLPSTIGDGPKISIYYKIPRSNESLGPGPGAYSPKPLNHVPSFLFGHSKNELFKCETISPGPVYKVEGNLIAPCLKFGTEKREVSKVKNTYPGPGTYESESTLAKGNITFKSRHSDLKDKYIKTVPGPGTYDHEVENNCGLTWSIGEASRKLDWTEEEKKSMKEKSISPKNPSLKKSHSKLSYKKKY